MQGLAPAQEFSVDLGKLLQTLPVILIAPHPILGSLLRGGSFEQELGDMARSQVGRQIVKGAMTAPVNTGAVWFATGREPFHVGSPEQVRADGEQTQQRGLSLAEGQGGGVAEFVYLSHDGG